MQYSDYRPVPHESNLVREVETRSAVTSSNGPRRPADAALASLAQTLRLDPHHVDAFYLTGMCLRAKEDRPGAIAAFEQVVRASPGMIPAHEELADLYAATGRRNEEIDQLQLIAALDRDHVNRQVAVGLAHLRASRAARDAARQERQAGAWS